MHKKYVEFFVLYFFTFSKNKLICPNFDSFLNVSKYCGSVLKNDFVVLVVVADELLSVFQRI